MAVVSPEVNLEHGFSKGSTLDKTLLDSKSPRFSLDSLMAIKGNCLNSIVPNPLVADKGSLLKPIIQNPPLSDVKILKERWYD